ncbi:Pirin-like protein [Vitis vinifera]|uniref:Pirin-like protein n=1 Tax=Vitis vinifera TaxID=29760 RepID=A0A438J0K4_VITVI|nr:Pirin-like protein [Vitis vinifera]
MRKIMSGSDHSSGFDQLRLMVKKVLAKPQREVAPLVGFPDHPHRSFETVTYMLQGAFTHQDFVEHKGTIRTGNVQWMTVRQRHNPL